MCQHAADGVREAAGAPPRRFPAWSAATRLLRAALPWEGWRRGGAAREVDEILVHTPIPGEFGMERRHEQTTLPRCNDATIGKTRQHLDRWPHCLDQWGADEDGVQRRRADDRDRQVNLKALALAAEGVALDPNVHHAEELLIGQGADHVAGQEDEARAGAWEDVVFATQGGSAAFRDPKFDFWIGFDF